MSAIFLDGSYFQSSYSGADSGLVKLVEMTNFFFNN